MKTPQIVRLLAVPLGCAALLAVPTSLSATSLVSRYSFSETSGTIAHDTIGGYNGTLQGSSSFNGAGSVVLRGTNGAAYVSLPTNQLTGLSGAVTFESWFTFYVPNNNVHLFSIDDGSGTGSGGSYMRYNIYDTGNGNGGTNYFENIISWGGNALHGGSILPTAVTNHITLVYDPVNGVKEIYLNGALSSSASSLVLPALNTFPLNVFTLGRSPWATYGDPYLNGAITEFRVYSGALTASEVAANDAAGPDSIPVITVGVPVISPGSTVYAGEAATISCGVSGPATGYHWEWDSGSGGASFTAIPGATSLSYPQNTTSLLGGYQYRLIATNASSSVTSTVATLTVNAATAPVITTDTTPNPASVYTSGTITFSAAFDGNHPIAYQWQVDKGTGFTNISGATSNVLTLSNVQLSDAGNYRLAATNSVGGNASTSSTLTVKDISLAKYQWQAPASINGLNADQVLTNITGNVVDGASFGATAYAVTLGNGRIIHFTTDGSIASATGNGLGTGAYPAGTGLSTGNANFDSVLNEFSWDGGPKTIYLNNLQIGQQYSVQLFGIDDRNDSSSESNRLANFQDPADTVDVSATFKMGDNVYVVGTFWASNTSEGIQMNLPTGNSGNINALVLRALSFTPANQPPTVTGTSSLKIYSGRAAYFSVSATSYVIPTYQWQAGAPGGPYTNLSNGGVLSGVNSNVLTIANASVYAGAEFICQVSNPAGSATSGPGDLTVLALPPSSGAAGGAALSEAPVAYWPLNENSDPSSGGLSAYDAAGTYDGTYLAAAQNAFNGIVGVQASDGFGIFNSNPGALGCSGVAQDWVTTPPLNLNTNTVTISMWIYPNGVQNGAAGLYVDQNSGTVAGLSYFNSDRLGYKWNNDAQPTWSFGGGPLIPTNEWSFIALVVEPSQAILYLYNTNGLQSGTNAAPHNAMSWGGSESGIRMGCNNNGSLFNGRIDEVAVFNKALTASQLLAVAGVPSLQIQNVGSQARLQWPYGTLLEATSLNGPWTTNANSSPYLFTPSGPQKFFRVRAN